jgi:hypothetical protein
MMKCSNCLQNMLPTVIVFGHSVDLQHINKYIYIYIYITNERVSLVWGYMGRVLRHNIYIYIYIYLIIYLYLEFNTWAKDSRL